LLLHDKRHQQSTFRCAPPFLSDATHFFHFLCLAATS
jgi:hypothetical protein